MSERSGTNNQQPVDIGPDKLKRKPLSAEQTDLFYKAACSMPSRRRELTGRVILDYGTRAGELAHSFPDWIEQKRHPRTGELGWCLSVPSTEICTGGNKDAQQANKSGADLHTTTDPCTDCVDRAYGDKDWVDDAVHSETPWHAKSARSFQHDVWCIPKQSANETARLWKKFLEPNRQWPVGASTVNTDVSRIVDRANEIAEDNPDEYDQIERNVVSHALRHTFGCRLAAAGYNAEVRMRQLRHGSYRMALYYSEAWGLRHRDQVQNTEWEANEDF